jgi:integrase
MKESGRTAWNSKAACATIFVFFSILSRRTHECLPCGLHWRKKLVELFRKTDSRFWWFDFKVRGKRYRGSTKERNSKRAGKIAALKLAQALEGTDPLVRKVPTLAEFAKRFTEWLETARLEPDTRRYYLNGWRLLQTTTIPSVKLNHITPDVVEALRFEGSPANGNNALRTLRRMLNKAREWRLIREVPRFRLFKEEGRALRLDDDAERKLLPVAGQPLRDIIVLMRDTGMRNSRELYRMRVENIDWNNRVTFNPNSKTKKGRRFVPMRDRVLDILLVRCANRKEGWVFPSRQKGKQITGGLVNKQWVRARKKAGLPKILVLYCARHDFGTYVLQTGNIAVVMNTMGHSDVKTAMTYQHPELNVVREAIDARQLSGHVSGHRSEMTGRAN